MSKIAFAKRDSTQSPPSAAARLFFLALYLVAIGSFVFEFKRYVARPGLSGVEAVFGTLAELLRRWGVPDALLILTVWLASYLFGKRFLQAVGVVLEPAFEQVWFSTVLGLSLISLATACLAFVHLLYRAAAYALLILPIVIWFDEVRRIYASAIRPRIIGRLAPSSIKAWSNFLLIAFLVVILGVVYLAAVGPEFKYDAYAIHLAAAKEFVQHHRLVSLRNNPQTFFPRNIHMLFAFGMLLHSDITAKLVNYFFGVLAFAGAYCLGVRLHSRSAGLVATAVLASSPLFLWSMKTAHIDCGFALFCFASLYAVLRWLDERSQPWFVLAVYATAFALGTRYQALFSLGALSLVVLFQSGPLRTMPRLGFRKAASFFFYSLIGMLPWGIANAIQTRNPVFPFLNGIFHSPYWSPEQTDAALWQQTHSGVPVTVANWWAVVTNLWAVSVNRIDFHGNIGIFYLLLIPLLIFRRRLEPALKAILLFAAAYWMLWVFTGQHARYVLGLLPGLAVVAGIAFADWLQIISRKLHAALAVAAAVLVFGFAILSTPFFEAYGASPKYGSAIIDSIPWDYLTGSKTRDEYLSRRLPEYAVVERLNELPGPKKVVFWFNTGPEAFYLNGETVYVFSSVFHRLMSDNPEDLRRVLVENHITHVLTGQMDSGTALLADPEKAFVHRYLKKIYENNGIDLYEFSSTPLHQVVVWYDFLNHLADATIEMPDKSPNKPNTDYRSTLAIANDSRYVQITHPPATATFTMSVPAVSPALRFAIGRQWLPCMSEGTFRVWISLPEAQKQLLFEQTIRAQNDLQELGWFDEKVDLDEYAGRKATITFETTSDPGKGCDWFLWAHPQITGMN